MLATEEPALRRHWHPVAWSADVGQEPVPGRLLGERVVVWRAGGTVQAARDRCPHRGAALSGGWLDGECLVCPYHAWQYGADGKAVAIPQLDDGVPIPPRAQLTKHYAAERYGLVWVSLDEPIVGIPDFPEGEDAAYRVIPEFFEVWSASAARVIDNSLDLAHVPVVHRATIGDINQPRIAHYDVERTPTGLTVRVPTPVKEVATQGAATAGGAERDFHAEICGPFTFVGRIGYETGAQHILFTVATPIDDTSSWFVQLIARNDTESDAPAADLVALDREVTLEDQAIVESTDPDFPLDPTAEVHLRADRVTLEYRRYLAEVLGSADPEGG